MTTEESREVAEALYAVLAWEVGSGFSRIRFASEVKTLMEAVRKDERERIFGVPDEERAKWGQGFNGLVGDY